MPAHAAAVVEVTLNVPAATAGSSNATALSYREAAGLITFTPVSGVSTTSDISLRVPYLLVPRPMSEVGAMVAPGSKLAPGQTATVDITNKADAPLSGDADFYAWGLADAQDGALKKSPADVRAIGVQSFPGPDLGLPATERGLIFAVNTWDAWSNPSSVLEMDIFLDVDNDGTDDYVVVGVDQGAVQTGTSNGRYVATVFSTRSAGFGLDFFATAKTDSSTAELPIRTARLCRGDNPATPANDPEPCLNAANPRFTYHAVTFDRDGGVDVVSGTAKFNAWSPSISTGGFQTVAPGASATEDITINAAEWALTPALGRQWS